MLVQKTIADVRSEVLRRLAQEADGENSDDLLTQINGLIADLQRSLCLEYQDLLPKQSSSVTVTGSRRWYPLPSGPEGIVRVMGQFNGTLTKMAAGMTLEDVLSSQPAIPNKYDTRYVKGVTAVGITAAGTGYTNGATFTSSASPDANGSPAVIAITCTSGAITGVTILDPGAGFVAAPTFTLTGGTGATLAPVIGKVLELFVTPVPNVGGSIWFEYREIPDTTVNDTDSMVFDAPAVIALAAAQVATATTPPHPLAAALSAVANKYVTLLAKRSPFKAGTGSPMSMSGRP